MSDPILSVDDPRLTAYAVGQLRIEDRAAVEAFIATHPEAQALVAETRVVAGQLEAALAFEAQADPDAQVWAEPAVSAPEERYRTRRATLLQFPQLYYVIGGLAAACVAVLVALHEEKPHPVRYYRVAVTPSEPAAPTSGVEADESEPEAIEAPAIAAAPSTGELAPPLAPLTESLPRTPRVAPVRRLSVALLPPPNEERDEAGAGPVREVVLRRKPSASYATADVPEQTRPPISAEPVNDAWPLPLSKRTVAVAGAEHPLADPDPDLHLDAFVGGAAPAVIVGDALPPGAAGTNGFVSTGDAPIAWVPFSDADTGLSNLMTSIENGHIPSYDDVRIGAWLNTVANEAPARPDAFANRGGPVDAWIETAAAPWAPAHRLVRIGVHGRGAIGAGPGGPAADAVAIQVAFDPARVAAYRLIGYERTRGEVASPAAGEPLAAGRTVTALFEIVPATAEGAPSTIPLLTLHVQYRVGTGAAIERLLLPAIDPGRAYADASEPFRFAAAVAAYGMVLQDSPFRGTATLDRAIGWARAAFHGGQGRTPAQADFVRLMELTTSLIR